MTFKKTSLLFFILFSFCTSIYAFKINIPYGPVDDKGKHKNTFVMFAMLDTGFSINGVSDGIGVTDYQSYFLRTGLTIWHFSFAFDINIRFRIFTMEPSFKTNDWYVAGDPIMTAFAYLDKIQYIRFGNENFPIYVTTGLLPYTTFGTGFLVNNFNNNSFSPIDKENCVYAKFNGKQLGQLGTKNIPFEYTFFCPDILDPDIFAMNANVDIFDFFKKLNKTFALNIGATLAMDFDANESNRLSSIDRNTFSKYRNIQTDGYTTSVIGTSIPITFSWNLRQKVKLIAKNETAFLWQSSLNDDKTINPATTTFSFGNNTELEVQLVYLQNSGYLLGIKTGFIAKNNDYYINYFSSNYQITRKKQFVNKNTDYSLITMLGLGLYGFHNKISFSLRAFFDMNHIYIDPELSVKNYCYIKFDSCFRLADMVVKGLTIDFFFETSLSKMEAKDSKGGYFMRGITRDCRLYFDICYTIFSAKIRMLIGIQSPAWNNESEYVDPSNLSNFDVDKFAADFQKFVGVEVSFVL